MINQDRDRLSKFAKIIFNNIFLLGIVPVTLGLACLVSCETKSNKQDSENGSVEKNLRISLTENIKSLNPLKFTNKSEVFLGKQLYEGLYTMDQTGKTIPQLVQEVELDTINKRYTFTLKRSRKFSNGDAITANNIYLCFNLLFTEIDVGPEVNDFRTNTVGFSNWWPNRNQANSGPAPSGFQLIDDFTLSLSVLNIDRLMIEKLAGTSFLIYKQHASNEIIGSGPFQIEYANDDISYNLMRNPFYSLKSNGALIDGINIRFIKNQNAVMDEFINGALDVLSYKVTDQSNIEIEKSIANDYDYKDYVQQYSGLVRYMVFHNFKERHDIMKIGFSLNETFSVGFFGKRGWEYDSTNFEALKNQSASKPDSTQAIPIPVINKSKLDNDELLAQVNTGNSPERFRLASISNIDLNSEYIVVHESTMELHGGPSFEETMKYLFEIVPNQKPNLELTVIGYEHDLIIFDERFSGFTKFGDWSLDIKNLTYTKPRLIP